MTDQPSPKPAETNKQNHLPANPPEIDGNEPAPPVYTTECTPNGHRRLPEGCIPGRPIVILPAANDANDDDDDNDYPDLPRKVA